MEEIRRWTTLQPFAGTGTPGVTGDGPRFTVEVIPYDHPEDMTKPWIRDSHFIPIVLVYSLCMVVGSCGNALFMWAMQCDRRGRSVTGMFLVSLAVADLMLLLSAPPDVASYFTSSQTSGSISCKMVGFSRMLSAFSTVLNLMAITVERFIVIVYPMRSRQVCTMKNCKITLFVVWMLAILMALPSVFTWEVEQFYYGKFENDSVIASTVVSVIFCEDAGSQLDRQIMAIYHLIFLFILPLTVQSLCYGKMIGVLWSSTMDIYLTSSHAGGHSASGKYTYKTARTPSAVSKTTLLLTDMTEVGASPIRKISISAHERLHTNVRNNISTSAAELNIAARELPSDLTGYQFSRNRSDSLAYTECPLSRASRRSRTLMTRLLKFGKEGSDPRYKSSASIATNGGTAEHPSSRQHNGDLKAGRRQVIKMLVAVNIAFIFCWGPMVVFEVLRQSQNIEYFGNLFYLTKVIVRLLPYAHCCLNPIIYGFMSKNFRKALRKACLTTSGSCLSMVRRPSSTTTDDELRIKSAQVFLSGNGESVVSQKPMTTSKQHRRRLSTLNL